MPRKLTKKQRDQLRVTSMIFVACDVGNNAITSANTTVDLCHDLDDADNELLRLRNALRMMMRHYMDSTDISPQEEDVLVSFGVLDKDKCFMTEEE